MRKHHQEMESLIFRNEQLTKRISVLQQELQVNSHSKKGKQKLRETNSNNHDYGILDEEFQKKILENAQLLSSISDKDLEIASYKDRIEWLEVKILHLESDLGNRDETSRSKNSQLEKDNEILEKKIKELTLSQTSQSTDDVDSLWKSEAEKWRMECEMLRSLPTCNEELTELREYYNCQLQDMLEAKTVALAETKSVLAENQALKSRLENLIVENRESKEKFEKTYEDLITTNENYKGQLDAMTEHLATQNEKITRQCDEIQHLQHKLSLKK
ncbi:hypothetical protein ABEB36_015356 [Hypothenemus hampei]